MDTRELAPAPTPGEEPPAAKDLQQPQTQPQQPHADAPPAPSFSPMPSALAAAAGTSPGALLAASLVRSRASYFERLSSGSRASTSCAAQGGYIPGTEASAPTTRQSTALAPHPLHPLAPHPLSASSRAGSEARCWREEEAKQQDADMSLDGDSDTESVDTFFDKPSYTRYGSNVELSAAAASQRCQPSTSATTTTSNNSSNGNSSVRVDGPQQPDRPAGGEGSNAAAAAAAAAAATSTTSTAPPAPPAGPQSPGSPTLPCSGHSGGGYVRSLSARFGSTAGGNGGRSGAAGMDGLFDELVTHVGALLASHPDVEAQMGMVQGLSDKLLELHAVCETLGRKEDEVEHLRGVLRELTATRAEAIRLKVQMAESLNGLQQEYYKVLRSAQLAQGTCKQHSMKAAATRKQLLEAQGELVRYKRAVAALRDRNRRLRADNDEMASRLHTLEQVRLNTDVRHSASYMAIVQAQTAVLY